MAPRLLPIGSDAATLAAREPWTNLRLFMIIPVPSAEPDGSSLLPKPSGNFE